VLRWRLLLGVIFVGALIGLFLLDIRYPGAPLVIGGYGYSDPGEPANEQRGYLGNMDYDPGEPLGNLLVNPHRPNRLEPRIRKRRPKNYPLMTAARRQLKKEPAQH